MTAYIASKGVTELYEDSLEAMLRAEPANPAQFLADHFASLTDTVEHKGALKFDAEAGSTTALEAEIRRLKAEVERLQTVNTRVEAENKRLKAGQDSSTRYQDAVCEWAQHGSDIPWVRAASPLKMGLISLETMYLVMYCHSFDVSFMYLKCISSVVFGASGRLVSLCIVYVSREGYRDHPHP